MPTTLVHLIRHGESAGNVDPALPRTDDPPLTPRGEAQADGAATALAHLGVQAIFSSPLRRARETAARVAAAVGLPVTLLPGFGEIDMGRLSAAAIPQERAERDALFAEWLAGDRRRSFPGGEDYVALTRRVAAALETASARGGVVAVVTHRMAIAAAVSLCLPIDLSRPAAPCANGSITTIRRVEDGRWVLVAPGDGDHLA